MSSATPTRSTVTVPFGPIELPLALLEAHERGEVVFFVGAGVSKPAGLPLFQGLVEELRDRFCDPDFLNVVNDDIAKGFLDRAIHTIETESDPRRELVRIAIAKRLLPEETPDISKTTHRSLLRLARTQLYGQPERCRLVTTNQDQLFELAAKAEAEATGKSDPFRTYVGPALPVPKRNWSGRIYLHGLLEPHHRDTPAEDLIFSSADFGRAYLTEPWATAFIRELVANHTIVFVGYSLNDPLVRYIGDALTADDAANGDSPRHGRYAFDGYEAGSKGLSQTATEVVRNWRRKGVEAIPYNAVDYHVALAETLREWADCASDFVKYRVGIVEQYANNVPGPMFGQHEYTRRVLWALNEATGKVAAAFARMDPVPPPEWLCFFTWDFSLIRAVAPKEGDPEWTAFGSRLLQIDYPYNLPGNALAQRTEEFAWVGLQPLQRNLLDWVVRSLGDPRMCFALCSLGNTPFEYLKNKIQAFLKQPDIDASVATLYELWLEGRLVPNDHMLNNHEWISYVGGPYSAHGRALFYDAMAVRLIPKFERWGFGKPGLSKEAGSVPEVLRASVAEYGHASTDAAYASAYLLEEDTLLFCRKAAAVIAQNEDVFDRLHAVGLDISHILDRRSISGLRHDERHFEYTQQAYALRVAIEQTPVERIEDVYALGVEWTYNSTRCLRLLGWWTLTNYGHFDWPRTIAQLSRRNADGIYALFDDGLWLEVARLLAAFAKTGFEDQNTTALELQAWILELDCIPYANADRDPNLLRFDRYERLRALSDAGAKLSNEAQTFAHSTEEQDARAKNTADWYSERRESNRDGSVVRASMVPRRSNFLASPPKEWPRLLVIHEDDDYDDWLQAVQSDVAAAIDALLEVESTTLLPTGRWAGVLSGSAIKDIPVELYGRVIEHIASFSDARLLELDINTGVLLMTFHAGFDAHIQPTTRLLFRMAGLEYRVLDRDQMRQSGAAVTFLFGAVQYFCNAARRRAFTSEELIAHLTQLRDAAKARGENAVLQYLFELTRHFAFLLTVDETYAEQEIGKALAFETTPEASAVAWQSFGSYAPWNRTEEAWSHARPFIVQALTTLPAGSWQHQLLLEVIRLAMHQHDLIPMPWLKQVLADLPAGLVAEFVTLISWQERRSHDKDADEDFAFWPAARRFYTEAFPSGRERTTSNKLTLRYLATILYAGEDAADAFAVLAPYLTALPYDTSAGSEGQWWLTQLRKHGNLERDAATWKAVLQRVYVDPRYRSRDDFEHIMGLIEQKGMAVA